jgi:sigma-B regulation protein RsbU (phosphoserine phosphatase)
VTKARRSTTRVAADHDGLDGVFRAYEMFARENRIPDAVRRDVYVALEELVSNVVRYGVTDRVPTMEVTLALEKGIFTVGISDDGPAFDPFTSAPVPDVTQALMDRPIGGLGVLFVQQLTDAHTYERQGDRNVVTLSRAIRTVRRRGATKVRRRKPDAKPRKRVRKKTRSPKTRRHNQKKARPRKRP